MVNVIIDSNAVLKYNFTLFEQVAFHVSVVFLMIPAYFILDRVARLFSAVVSVHEYSSIEIIKLIPDAFDRVFALGDDFEIFGKIFDSYDLRVINLVDWQ